MGKFSKTRIPEKAAETEPFLLDFVKVLRYVVAFRIIDRNLMHG